MEDKIIEGNIQSILEDLYKIDPEFRGKEEEIIKIIKKLLKSRPETNIDDNFKKELREKLLARFDDKKRERKKIWRLIGLSSAAACLVVAVFAVIVINITINTNNPERADSKVVYEKTETTNDILQPEKEVKAERSVVTGETSTTTTVARPEKEKSGGNGIASAKAFEEMEPSEYKPSSPAGPPGAAGQVPQAPDLNSGYYDLGPESNIHFHILSEESDLVLNEGTGGDLAAVLGDRDMPARVAAKREQKEVEEQPDTAPDPGEPSNTEEYDRIYENEFKGVLENPLSTFSIDVDTASYANVRRFLNSGQLPYPDAVRIEELVNYFNYDYPDASGEHPFSFTTELAPSPWSEGNRLLYIGIQGKKIAFEQMKPNNLVFLLDVSGSMGNEDKLPLLKKGLSLLVDTLRSNDRVAIVVYAGAAGVVLESTPGNEKQTIMGSLENLSAGGSTAGGAGIELAYKIAVDNFVAGGNNRIILATDGDFNVGASSDGELIRMIEEKRKTGIYLTILGFGSGNYKDSKMEQLADKGNGNYAYLDSILEAKKVLVNEIGGTLLTIAQDVKIQIEFNPAHVKSYRLIGYENRIMAAEDFADDTKDAGELGSGHTVTALYELVPADGDESAGGLKYQSTGITEEAYGSGEIMTLKFRYKKPGDDVSKLIEVSVANEMTYNTTDNFRFSAAVAGWGLLLRGSKYKGTASFSQVLELAGTALGRDENGYRSEFITLVKKSEALSE